MATETGVMRMTPQGLIESAREPREIIAEATERAQALKEVVDQKGLSRKFGEGEHLQLEAWQTVGKFYGVCAKTESSTYIEYEHGGVRGFEARAVVVRITDGGEISAAEAMCLNDEEKWRSRPKYEYHYVRKSDGVLVAEDPGPGEIVWEPNPNKPGSKRPKKERVLVGEVPVPLFQLRSMAQTRACSKALRNVLSWVVVLAGYKPTPAEEMDGVMPEAGENGAQTGPECPKCHGPMWDNRPKKESGEWPNAADFTCRDKKCGGKIPDYDKFLDEQGEGEASEDGEPNAQPNGEASAPKSAGAGKATAAQVKAIQATRDKIGMTERQLTDHVGVTYGAESITELSKEQAGELITYLNTFKDEV